MAFHEGTVTSAYVGLDPAEDEGATGPSREKIKQAFVRFIRLFRRENAANYKYQDELRRNVHAGNYFLEIDVSDIGGFDKKLKEGIISNPGLYLPLFEEAAKEAAQQCSAFASDADAHPIQIVLYWVETPTPIRDLLANRISKLICIPGIVINASKAKCKVIHATLQCRSCKAYYRTPVPANQQLVPPVKCQSSMQTGTERCQNNPYQIIPAMCNYVDQQFIKLQEMPEDVPTGELPRHVTLHLDRFLCDRVQPGKRVLVVGIQTLAHGKVSTEGRKAAGIRRPFIRAVGIFVHDADPGSSTLRHSSRHPTWQPEDEAKFLQMSQEPNLYQKIASSIDPAIYGLEDPKKAIACQLFAGTRKVLPDGSKLRGDLNMLLIGDPSTAKSQLLKYAHKVAPIGVYTSGKGSSAAGLTATVIRDGQGDFYLEGGALVLADGGVVCIDEFDKMGTDDQVAIHEAMEQQTISIAKAGITTVLNARASVLAAANPRFGSYDPLRSTEDQLDFQSTILTRFDLIFKILDPRDPERDVALAKHVIAIHKSGAVSSAQRKALKKAGEEPLFDIPTLKAYIDYCKHKCFPKLDAQARQSLQDFYVQAKKNTNQLSDGGPGSNKGSIVITVRQLEAIIRVAESLAKMHFRSHATRDDVEEAIRLFRVSTMDAISSGLQELALDGEQAEEIQKVEAAIRRRLGVGMSAPYTRLYNEFLRQGFEAYIIDRALVILTKREEIEWKQQRKVIARKR
eukprot:EG_transcript_4081